MLWFGISVQERWSEPGTELVSASHIPAASPMMDPSAEPDAEQKVKRFLAFSTGATPYLDSGAAVSS